MVNAISLYRLSMPLLLCPAAPEVNKNRLANIGVRCIRTLKDRSGS
jgi:hypothetical protein